MRLSAGLAAAAMALALAAAGLAGAQQGVLTPSQSAARAKQLIEETIQALGGNAYLDATDQMCEGQAAFFGFHDQLSSLEKVFDYALFPDKERIEFFSKRNVINVHNGNQGWTLDRGGVTDLPPDANADFERQLKSDINYLFRFQRKDPGLEFLYDGTDVVDLREVDWVEVDEGEDFTVRIAVARLTHLPVRAEYIGRDPVTHERTVETEYFSNYQDVQGIVTPYQDTRTRNGQKVSQFFVDKCQYNLGLKPDFFTRQALEQRWDQLGGNKKKKRS